MLVQRDRRGRGRRPRRCAGADRCVDHRVEVDVLVVLAVLGLGRRREDRLGQPVALAQPGRQRDAADRAARLVLLPAGAGEVAADDDLDRAGPSPAGRS